MEQHSETRKKVELLVRFANEGTYYNKITVDPSKIENPQVFKDEVFIRIDGITVAIRREDWDNLIKIKEHGN